MEAIWALKAHPAAALFPLMQGEEFDSLCRDIKENGQQEPIVLYAGENGDDASLILDGRNRFNACKKIGVKPLLQARIIEDPIAFVVSANVRRRHLTPSQLSTLGAEVEELRAVEAKKRMSIGGKTKTPQSSEESRGGPCGPPLERNGDSHVARNEASALTGASGRSIARAKFVKEKGCPELYQAVKDGKVNVRLAESVVKKIPTKTTQRAVVLAALAEPDPEVELKQHVADGGASATGKARPIGVLRANEAIDCLKRIPRNDSHRERGFQVVMDWIKHNK